MSSGSSGGINNIPLPKMRTEPSMSEQRPAIAASQDNSHVLNRVFGGKFSRYLVDKETVDHLATTAIGNEDDEYHQNYVKRLRQAQEEQNARIQKLANMEKMIIQARAKALSHYEKQVASGNSSMSAQNYISFMDNQALREHGLIVADDLFSDPFEYKKPEKTSKRPNYTRSTTGSREKNRPVPRDDGYVQTMQAILAAGDRSTDAASPEPSDFQEFMRPSTMWEDMPNAENREEAKKYLSIMNARQDYLRNPANDNSNSPESAEFHSPPFKPVPAKLVFSKFRVGQGYEMTLELKNTSSCQRKCRVLPPKSNKFSVSLGSFPTDGGLVAPGLSSLYVVNFVPETLADCDDEIIVQSDGFCDVVVPLQARRPPPLLTLKSVIDVGHCLVGGAKLSEFAFKNEGGDGSFFILPKSKWPATGYKNFVHGQRIVEAPFEVRPAMFYAPKGSAIPLEVLFLPKRLGKFSLDILFVCDNCNVRKVTLVGKSEEAKVELTKVSDGSLVEPSVEETIDPGAQKFIKFPPINPMTYAVRKLTIKNLTQVAMSFSWQIMKPLLVDPMTLTEQKEKESQTDKEKDIDKINQKDRQWDVSSPFSVSPNAAELPAGGEVECSAIFAAPYAKQFHNLFQLVLHNVPKVPDLTLDEGPGEPGASGSGHLTGRSTSKTSKLVTDAKSSAMNANQLPITLRDEVGLVVDVKGECVPYNVCFVPYCVDFSGKTLLGTTVRRPIQIMNNSLAPVYFRWRPVDVDENEIIEVEPAEGEIAEGYWASLEVAISRNKPGPIERELICEIEHQEKVPMSLKLTADIVGPDVQIGCDKVSFGLVRIADSQVRRFMIVNKSSISARWSFDVPKKTVGLQVINCSGVLAPLGSSEIELKYKPSNEEKLDVIGRLEVENGEESFVKIVGESQKPTLCLLNCEVNLGLVYMSVPVSTHVQLCNLTDFTTSFRWGEATGEDAEFCKLKIFPETSAIEPRETQDIEIQFMSTKMIEFTDLCIPCYVEDESPIWLSLKGRTSGLAVDFEVVGGENEKESSKDGQIAFDFGSVTLGEVKIQQLLIRNTTAIMAEYKLHVRNFPSESVPVRVDRSLKAALKKGERVGLLRQTPHLADPYSITLPKALEEYNTAVLKSNHGVAFVLDPPQGNLPPFGEVLVTLACYSDMWGLYTDTLIVNVGSLPAENIPITANVCNGCPISYQIMGALKVQEPILRFGTKIHDTETVKRSVQVNNNGPVDLKLFWKAYDYDPDNKKLVNLEMFSGRPLGDENLLSFSDVVEDQSPETTARTEMGSAIDEELNGLGSPGTVNGIAEPEIEVRTFLSLKVLLHNGAENSEFFRIEPQEITIPARSSVKLTASFIPVSPSGSDVQCFGFCQGFMSLEEKSRVLTGVTRLDQYDVDPVRFFMLGNIKPAKLSIELDEDTAIPGTICLEGTPSQLVDSNNGQMKEVAFSKHQMLKLSNPSEAPLSFEVFFPEFVSVWIMERKGKLKNWEAISDQAFHLEPQHHHQFNVALRISKMFVDDLIKASVTESSQESGIEVTTSSGGGKILSLNDFLQINYANGSKEEIPIKVTLSFPNFFTPAQMRIPDQEVESAESPKMLMFDFGSCFVGTVQSKELEIMNKTSCGSYWTIEAVGLANKSPGKSVAKRVTNDTINDVFLITPSSGYLGPFLSDETASNKQLIEIVFKSVRTEYVEREYCIRGQFGEDPIYFKVCGQGSQDGHYEVTD
ncbi:deleted in lung and esophageal cancer protein 1-like [Convolutriloba macropyga]|uniref:deleted in lung and esophageal cancer protein 1-like n=1 Tax=Convolutriloba macropyga TaxID=536237 RepID=UPI003F51F81B